MRTLAALLSIVVCSGLLAAPVATAQDSPAIQAVTEMVLAHDPEALLLELNTPLPDDQLPDGFINATLTDPNPLEGDTVSADDLEGGIGNVMYTVRYDHALDQGSTPVASPTAQRSGPMYNAASLNYIVLDREFDDHAMEEFEAAALETLGGNAQRTEVETITVGGVDAHMITTFSTTNGLQVIIQWIAIPVGTVMVISQLLLGGERVDTDAMRSMNESFALAGVSHLQAAVDPAG